MTDAERLWGDLDNHERELRREGFQLREIWHKTTELHAANDEEREKVEKKAKQNFLPPDERVVLNVGGQVFETTAGVLTKDRWSILASLCDASAPPMAREADGSFFIDRDWWIFRHILLWLRSDALPKDPMVLLEMYNEANFYRLQALCEAIRDLPGLPEHRFSGRHYT